MTLLAAFNVNEGIAESGWEPLATTALATATQNGITLTVDVAFSSAFSSGTLYNQAHFGVPENVLERGGLVNVGAGTQITISGLAPSAEGFIRFGGGATNAGRHRLLTVDSVTYQHDNPGGTIPLTPEPPIDALFVANESGDVTFELDAVSVNAVFTYFEIHEVDTLGPSITTADDVTTEGQTATFTLSGNTDAPVSATLNGTDVGALTLVSGSTYSYTAPLLLDDANASLVVTVDSTTASTTISYANSYPYVLTQHGTPNVNSIFKDTQFASNDPVEWGVVTDYDSGIVTVNHAAMDAAEEELNDVALHSTEVSEGSTTATYKYFVQESGETGTWQATIVVSGEGGDNGGDPVDPVIPVPGGSQDKGVRLPLRDKIGKTSLRVKL